MIAVTDLVALMVEEKYLDTAYERTQGYLSIVITWTAEIGLTIERLNWFY